MHLLRVVDGPDVHVDPAPVSELDEPASDDRDGPKTGGTCKTSTSRSAPIPARPTMASIVAPVAPPVHRSLPTRRFTRSVAGERTT